MSSTIVRSATFVRIRLHLSGFVYICQDSSTFVRVSSTKFVRISPTLSVSSTLSVFVWSRLSRHVRSGPRLSTPRSQVVYIVKVVCSRCPGPTGRRSGPKQGSRSGIEPPRYRMGKGGIIESVENRKELARVGKELKNCKSRVTRMKNKLLGLQFEVLTAADGMVICVLFSS